jgi:isocitrate/isopropylmalate dehydrogenase
MANPAALLLSAVMMLDHIGEQQQSARIRAALDRVLAAGRVRTRDLGGSASTTAFTEAVCAELAAYDGVGAGDRKTKG